MQLQAALAQLLHNCPLETRLGVTLTPGLQALLSDERFITGALTGLQYAPGPFRVRLGDVGNAEQVEVDGKTWQPLGQLQAVTASEASTAWLVFDPDNESAPVFLAHPSGDPEQVADSIAALLDLLC
jgi:hypothetical protein